MIRPAKKLVLETGQEFYGTGFGADCRKVCEIVFNTSVVGYQEIISDPSYAEQIVVMTYPLIGNYGITDEDFESHGTDIGGLVVRECCDTPSNFRYTKTLEEELEEHGIPCLSGVDTRMLTKIIRDTGRPMAAIVEADLPKEEALALIAASSAAWAAASAGSPALPTTCTTSWRWTAASSRAFSPGSRSVAAT